MIGGNGLTSGYVLSSSATTPTLTGALAGYKPSKPLTAYFSTTNGAINASFRSTGGWNFNNGATNMVSAGTATTFGAGTSITSFVPPSANSMIVSGTLTSTTAPKNLVLSFDGSTTFLTYLASQVNSQITRGGAVVIPVISQTVYYTVTGAGDTANYTFMAWSF